MIGRMLVSSKPGVVFIESIGAALFDLVSKILTVIVVLFLVIVVHSLISNLVDKCCSDQTSKTLEIQIYNKVELVETCAICLEKEGNGLYKLQCSHVFHQSCFTKWAPKKTCPLCRQKIF